RAARADDQPRWTREFFAALAQGCVVGRLPARGTAAATIVDQAKNARDQRQRRPPEGDCAVSEAAWGRLIALLVVHGASWLAAHGAIWLAAHGAIIPAISSSAFRHGRPQQVGEHQAQ